MPLDLEAGVDRLYEVEPGEFVAERKSLAKALKREGRKAEAAQVEELRKPTLPAWTVNQIARRKRKSLDALLAVGERLAEAQQALLAGGGRAAFAEARRREQAALKRLRDDAAWILGKRATDATLDRVVSTLGSAAVTADGRAQLAQGRLTADIEPQGFEAFVGSLPTAAAKAKRPSPGRKAQAAPRESAAARRRAQQEAIALGRERLKAARERETELAEERRDADRAVTAARKALDSAERTRARVEADQATATRAVSDARSELDAAKRT